VIHAERPRPKRFVHVFRCRAAKRDLEIVNDPRAVRRKRRDEPALHQVDQHRREAGLQHMRAKTPDDRRTTPPCVGNRRSHGLEIVRGKK
jgi:hypothetical protein